MNSQTEGDTQDPMTQVNDIILNKRMSNFMYITSYNLRILASILQDVDNSQTDPNIPQITILLPVTLKLN